MQVQGFTFWKLHTLLCYKSDNENSRSIQYWWCLRTQRPWLRLMTQCNGHPQVKMCGQECAAWHCDTLHLPQGDVVYALFCFVSFIYFFILSFAGRLQGQIQRDGELSGPGVMMWNSWRTNKKFKIIPEMLERWLSSQECYYPSRGPGFRPNFTSQLPYLVAYGHQ